MRSDRMAGPVHSLVSDRPLQPRLHIRNVENNIAMRIPPQVVRAYDFERNLSRFCMRGNLELTFELSLRTVVGDVNSFVDSMLCDPAKIWNVRKPLFWIGPAEVAALAR